MMTYQFCQVVAKLTLSPVELWQDIVEVLDGLSHGKEGLKVSIMLIDKSIALIQLIDNMNAQHILTFHG